MTDHVVLVGMACQYAEAHDPDQLWQNVMSRRLSFRPLPAERLPLDEYGGTAPDRTYVTRAAVLDGWNFDRQRYRVPGTTFRAVDLTHWLALDVSAEALADAGIPGGDGVDRSRVGVVLGNSLTGEFSRAANLRTRWPYVRRSVAAALAGTALSANDRDALLAAIEEQYKAPFPEPSDETLAGALANTIAGRICNHFDFQGTGYTVDGACASSLLAISTAAEAVTAGRLDVALSGGVDLSLDPFELVGFARVGALAERDMRVYDRRPTGFLPGEGCGMVVLCRESYAHQRGLRPYARLLGWGISSDGNGGLTRPELAGQRLALGRAYEAAQLSPTRVGLVEGHGTGTDVGDQTELHTLLDVRGRTTARAALGSIKANIGHTKAAAGAAGVIKAALAVHREVLPPTTGCQEPHPLLADSAATLEILDEARPWPGPDRYASVSSMGFGGINTHLVLGGMAATGRRAVAGPDRRLAARHPDRELVVCAADSPAELADRLRAMQRAAQTMSRGELSDLAATYAAQARGTARARFAAAVASPDELAAAAGHALDRLADGDGGPVLDRLRRTFLVTGRPLRVGLLFSGQAAPCYPDPGALGDLLNQPLPGYADRLDLSARHPSTDVAQPAIVRASLAGLRWLDLLGARVHGAVGHSLGELCALMWAGALREDEAYALARSRGAAMAAASRAPSGMVALSTGLATARELVDGTGAVVAADNGAEQVVTSGTQDQLELVEQAARQRGVTAARLPVRHAFHSPLMAAAAPQLKAAAAGVQWHRPARPVVSTVTGDWLRDADPVELLVDQLTAPVRFREALAMLDAEMYVEVGPGTVLATLAGSRAVSLDVGAASADGVATATAALFAAGAVDSVEPYFVHRFTRPFDLDRARAFLTNPCESHATGTTRAPAPPPAEPERPPARGPATPADPLTVTIARVAAAVELDMTAVTAGTRLLADLHLSSLRVTQLAAGVAADLGRALPAAPLALATATVEELAGTVAALPAAGSADAPPAGVANWVRVLRDDLAPVDQRPTATGEARCWQIVGNLAGHPLTDAIRAAFPARTGAPPARLLALPPGLDPVPAEDVVAALRQSHADRYPLVVVHHGGLGAAVARSLRVERPDVPVLAVEVPPDALGIAFAAREAHRPLHGHAVLVCGPDGAARTPVLRPVAVAGPEPSPLPLAPGDLCLVTGGAKGIGLECAAGLAAASGARLLLLGRDDAGRTPVRAALDRLAAQGTEAFYRAVDLSDAAAVARVLGPARRELGPVRTLLHCAGRNDPALIPDLTAEKLRATLAPKAAGLAHVLASLDLAELRVAVTFGSVISRTGLAGEADYAIANEWLARRCAELAVEHPGVRWLNIAWSAWADAGMGVRLGALDGLVRQGLTPIPVDEGVAMLIRLLATPALPASVVVTGRLPATPTLPARPDRATARFLESTRSYLPQVELVSDAYLSAGTDPYLADHRIDGTLVMPAVFGLEAMAQACTGLGTVPLPGAFTGVELTRPVTVPERDRRQVRTAALVREDGRIDLVLRSDETGFGVDHFRATFEAAEPVCGEESGEPPLAEPVDAGPFYGSLFFHGPRFQRVLGYRGLSADRCAAVISADEAGQWFDAFHDQRVELGDAGARDAFLHALQACVPDRRVLPTGVERIDLYRPPAGRLALHARQRRQDGDDFVFDVSVRDGDGHLVERWLGLALRAIAPVPRREWPAPLLGPYLARGLRRWRPGLDLDLAVAPAARNDQRRTEAIATWLTAGAKPSQLSASHLDGHVLVAAASGRIAVDWERVGTTVAPLPDPDRGLAGELAGQAGEDPLTGGYRVWTCREALRKLGLPPGAPLVLDRAGPDGWQLLASGPYRLHSTVVATELGPVAVCVCAE